MRYISFRVSDELAEKWQTFLEQEAERLGVLSVSHGDVFTPFMRSKVDGRPLKRAYSPRRSRE